MPEKKPVWGVIVKVDTFPKRVDSTRFRAYSAEISKKRQGVSGFFTHASLHKKIVKVREEWQGAIDWIGYSVIRMDHQKKRLVLSSFYPSFLERLRGQGIATHMMKVVLKDLMRRHKDYKIKIGKKPSQKIEEYLITRGIDPTKEYSLQEYLELIKAYEGGKNA